MFQAYKKGSQYVVHSDFETEPIPNDKGTLWLCAIDPGVTNTGLRIEERDLLEETVTTIHMELFSTPRGVLPSVAVRSNLSKILPLLQSCHYIVVESQMSINRKAVELSVYIIQWLCCSLKGGNNPYVIEVTPQLKSTILLPPKKSKSKDLKKMAVDWATDALVTRGDSTGRDIMKASKKKDDLSDVIVYCEAWFSFLMEGSFTD